MIPSAVVIHGLPQARLALDLQSPLTLVSAASAGARRDWWQALMALVAAEYGPMPDILDCGANPAQAVEALRAGCRQIVLDPGPAPHAIWSDVTARASVIGAVVHATRPPAFDLAGLRPRDARYHLAAWLRSANSEHNAQGNGT